MKNNDKVLKKLISLNSIELVDVDADGFPLAIGFNSFDIKTGILKYYVIEL
jgi:hypothetical protein